jgi:hypothetical protein
MGGSTACRRYVDADDGVIWMRRQLWRSDCGLILEVELCSIADWSLESSVRSSIRGAHCSAVKALKDLIVTAGVA